VSSFHIDERHSKVAARFPSMIPSAVQLWNECCEKHARLLLQWRETGMKPQIPSVHPFIVSAIISDRGEKLDRQLKFSLAQDLEIEQVV